MHDDDSTPPPPPVRFPWVVWCLLVLTLALVALTAWQVVTYVWR
jgi:hypothetical protein